MTKIRCTKCGKIIEGDKHGTFITCNCKKGIKTPYGQTGIFIDETEEYCRIGFKKKAQVEIFNGKQWITLDKWEKSKGE